MKMYIKNITFNLYVKNNILYESNVVYLLKINNKTYVGKTKRELIKRIKEHVGEIIHNNDDVFVFVLDRCNSNHELDIKERKWIKYCRK